MTENLENELYSIDPVFFEEAVKCIERSMNQLDTCMYWGCECGDGWFKPLKKFVKKVKIINDELKKYNQKIVCNQLKEKWGELTVYRSHKYIEETDKKNAAPSELFDMYDDAYHTAIDECWNVCEICGAEGGYNGNNLITTNGWISRICKKCNKEQIENETKMFDERNNLNHIPRITLFKEGYEFLSPFHIKSFQYNEKYYRSIIEAFYSIKDKQNADLYETIGSQFSKSKISPSLIKEIANRFSVFYEDNIEDYNLLKDITKAKFTYEFNSDIKSELLETNGKLLQNMGKHHDNILGHCVCDKCKDLQHKDLFAKILMEIRDELNEENK